MRNLIVVCYDSQFKAEEMRLNFLKMQKDYLVSVEDAVVATKNAKGKVRLNQLGHPALAGLYSGSFWGLLVGLLFLNPLLGLVVGAGTGAAAGALTDLGINDQFMKELAANLKPDASALFLLLDTAVTDRVLEEVKGSGGTVIRTSLSHEDQRKLQAALDESIKTATLA